MHDWIGIRHDRRGFGHNGGGLGLKIEEEERVGGGA